MMASSKALVALLLSISVVRAACPYMTNDARNLPTYHHLERRNGSSSTDEFFSQYEVDDQNAYLTSDVGGPFTDQNSLKAGERGPTLLEDFIFRQKITHFDHERVPERAVHARGAGAHGIFESYGDHSALTAASFLGSAKKQTPVFIRFSTVAGSRGSADTARDVHGFAVRFYTDEGNYDIVGNNIPVFFIQDAILFPDLIHSVKPMPDREIPQAATAHDTAWDFFSQQPSTLHTLFWAMSGHGTVRSYRHMDGWGVHTFRLVTDDGKSKLVKFRFKTLQGKASLLWEEAQATSGKNADFHRQDLFDSINKGRYPEWEFQAQIIEEEDQLKFGFDVLDPTKIIPEDLVPFTPLGKLTLNRNPRNYFAETEQIMFQPAHIVRGIDFTEDPLLQGRLFSYLDTQINRHGGPNFEQLPINQPRVPVHNNNRDGAGQMFIPLNTAAYSPNTLNKDSPRQANQTTGKGFFTAPSRSSSGKLVRVVSSTFADVWSQPRLFFNSLTPTEQQNVINAIRFETSQLQSSVVKSNVLIQLNRVSHELATRVASALGIPAPEPDTTYYHNNSTVGVSVEKSGLNKTDGLKVAWLTSNAALRNTSSGASSFRTTLATTFKADLVVVAESLGDGIDQTYSASDAIQFDAIFISDGAGELFKPPQYSNATKNTLGTLYPPGRPLQIILDSYRYGKSVAAVGTATTALDNAGITKSQKGVFYDSADLSKVLSDLQGSLLNFKWYNRFATDS